MKTKVPSEYQKGFVWFLNCKIDLSQRVFIPRPETEFWVKKVIVKVKSKKDKVKVLDIFSGSGCIGIAILKNIKKSEVHFVDIDKNALKQIKINLRLNKVDEKKCQIYNSDLFQKLEGQKYDFILANPPYVAEKRLSEVENSVLEYEPQNAILAGKEGLKYIKRFFREAKKFLKEKGLIYLEFDPGQKKEIENILIKEDYQDFNFFKDQFGKYRFLTAGF